MRYITITIFTLLSILLTSSFTSAQAPQVSDQASRDFRLKVTLLDSLRLLPIEFATVSIRPAGATEALKYGLSDASGRVELSGIPEGSYTLKIEYMGYKTYIITVAFTGDRLVDLGKVKLQEQVNNLDAVVVTAVGNPIIVKKDTIEYNASSFKTTDGDMLEQLLKKMPGIEIDSDGKITANGKEITKIMIDGKTFFLNDPQLATKNLPAKIIDKVKVVEKKSEQALFTGIDDGNQETVIDLTIRPGMMNGWFGNMSAGYGTDDRFQAAAMSGNFTSTSQLTFVGNANNTNNRGFMDLAGGMMRSMRSSMGGGGGGFGGGNVRIGGSVMNFGNNGISTTWMAGLNANTESKDKKLKIGGSYLYNGSDNLSINKSFKQNFLVDSSFNYAQQTTSNSVTEGHNASLNLEYQITDKASVLFRPNVNIGYGTFSDNKDFSTNGASGTKINSGTSSSVGDNQSQKLSGDLLYRQKTNKEGRTFSINVNYGLSNNDLNATNYSRTDIFGARPKTNLVDQKYNLNSSSYNLGARASYTEPLGNKFYMELAYSYNFTQNNSEKEAYNKNQVTGEYTERDSVYSNTFKNKFINQRGEINIRKIGEKYNYIVGFNVQPAYTESIGDTTYFSRNVVNFAPSGMFEYNFSDTEFMRIRYRGNTNQPSISQLQPVPDNSNPLYIPLGNPDLLPEFRHSFSLDYRNTKRETFRTMEAEFEAELSQNKIVNKIWYDNGGIQYNLPVNENGIYSLSGNFSYSTPISKSKFYISTNTRLRFNNGINYSNGVRNLTSTLSASENLRFSYRGEKLETSFGGTARYSKAWYSIEQYQKADTWTNSVTLSMNWTLPAGFNLTSDFDYRFYIGFGEGYNESAAVWNAEASKLLFKKMGTLRLKIFDILNQTKTFRRTTADNYIEDVETNALRQYIMLSFTWRFGTFGGQKGGEGRTRGEGFRQGGGMRFH
ncbi:MAG: hypothetical protein A2X18_12990 [Bacteroidetes bacterium GWF2_40_14]|nr:MAG: hypothetical protein A2X18_12990 [Bacteroidetes bacterium GWF2_40_14]